MTWVHMNVRTALLILYSVLTAAAALAVGELGAASLSGAASTVDENELALSEIVAVLVEGTLESRVVGEPQLVCIARIFCTFRTPQ